MTRRASFHGTQRGALTLFLGLVMLLLITAMVMAAFTLGASNLKAVGNLQAGTQALAGARMVIETELAQPFHRLRQARHGVQVDVDADGTTDHEVNLAAPECVLAVPVPSAAASSVSLPEMDVARLWDTTWELVARVDDPRSGARFEVVQGLRVVLGEADRELYCN